MIEYLDVDDKNVYIGTYRRKPSWIEVPKGTEVITGDRFDKYSLVFWKPSIGEVWNHNRFAKYVLQDSVSYEEYVDRWTNDPVVWKRPERTKKQNELGEQTMKQVRQMIQLNEDYALSADSMNILLHQRKVNQREGTKGYGDEYYSVIAYYSSIESVLRALINKQIQINLAEQTSLESLINSVETYVSLLHDNVVKVVKSLR